MGAVNGQGELGIIGVDPPMDPPVEAGWGVGGGFAGEGDAFNGVVGGRGNIF